MRSRVAAPSASALSRPSAVSANPRWRRETNSFSARRRTAWPRSPGAIASPSFGPVDAHSHDVFLVEGPASFGRRFDRIRDADLPALEQLVGDVQGDRDVQHFEANAAVVTPELASGINLNQATAAIAASLSDRTVVDYFGTQAWGGYVSPAGGCRDSSRRQP